MDPESLFARARLGDKAARNDLLVWCRPLVRALLRRNLPALPEDASELTNDVLLRMHNGFDGFRGKALRQFLAWAMVITTNHLRDHLRRPRARLLPLNVEPPSPQPDVSAPMIRAEDQVRLAAALETLPENYRRVIEARLLEGLPPHVIAEQFGWPQTRVRVYSMRAVELLAEYLRGGE
jgi:RNA polymerase sigma-70 factor (ECF subfamily)